MGLIKEAFDLMPEVFVSGHESEDELAEDASRALDVLGIDNHELTDWVVEHVPKELNHYIIYMVAAKSEGKLPPMDFRDAIQVIATAMWKNGFQHGAAYHKLRTERIRKDVQGED